MDEILLKKLCEITLEEKKILGGKDEIDVHLYATEGKSFVVESEKLLAKGKLVQVRPHTRFVHFPRHRHDYVEVTYVCKGCVRHILNNQEVVLNEGDLLFLNQQVWQEIYPAGEEDIAVNFIILPEFFDTAFKMIGSEENLLSDFLLGCLNRNAQAQYLLFHTKGVLPVQNLIENIIWSLLHDMPYKQNINQFTMGTLFMHLLNFTDKMEMQDSSVQDFILKVLRYVEDNYRKGSLTELASIMNCKPSWLSKEIIKKSGKTFKEILQTKRLNQASYLLKHTKLSVEEIIRMVGYENTSYFYRRFKENFGMSPHAYRE